MSYIIFIIDTLNFQNSNSHSWDGGQELEWQIVRHTLNKEGEFIVIVWRDFDGDCVD